MLIRAERLLVRVRQVPARADELIELRARVRAAAHQPAELVPAACRLRVLKERVSAALGDVQACRTCAHGKRGVRGVFAGGDCCAGVTADLFSDDEVAALVAAGTRPRHLTPPRDAHAGCAFRGATGCTLATAHRPQRCVHYACDRLRDELRARGDLPAIEALLADLRATMEGFVRARAAHDQEQLASEMEDAIRAALS